MNNYQELAKRTFTSTGSISKDVLHCKAGILGEYGEVIDCYKKKIFTPNRFKDNVAEEWCDGLWYIAMWHELRGEQLDLEDNVHPYLPGNDEDLLEALIIDTIELATLVQRNKLFDVTRFWFVLAAITGVDVARAMAENIAKLEQRKKDGAYDLI